jgi:hypothetical protein
MAEAGGRKGEIEGEGLDGSQFNRYSDGHPWRSLRYGDIIFKQGEPEMPPVRKSNRAAGPFSSRPYRRGGTWPSSQRLLYKARVRFQTPRYVPVSSSLLHTRDSPGPKNGMGIMTKSPRATLFRGDEAQSPGSRVTPA